MRFECPNGCDNRGKEIPPESLAKGYYGPWDGTERRYFSEVIGVQIPELYDGVAYWACPKCGARWHRFPAPGRIRDALAISDPDILDVP